LTGGALAAAAAASAAVAMAGGGVGDKDAVAERLSGYQEDPLVLSTAGTGTFEAAPVKGGVAWRLSYSGLEGEVSQAHIHLGGRHQSGGIAVWLCGNVPNTPAGTQPCPPAPATITGTIRAADVVGPDAQGIAPGEFQELTDAARAGVTYVNVHSSKYPGGEIRAQLRPRRH
jgi:hypothetical protein